MLLSYFQQILRIKVIQDSSGIAFQFGCLAQYGDPIKLFWHAINFLKIWLWHSVGTEILKENRFRLQNWHAVVWISLQFSDMEIYHGEYKYQNYVTVILLRKARNQDMKLPPDQHKNIPPSIFPLFHFLNFDHLFITLHI